jgi:hypothetical protein
VTVVGHFLPSADRNTHLKIVGVALAVVALLAVGLSTRTTHDELAARSDAGGLVVKAGKPTTVTSAESAKTH